MVKRALGLDSVPQTFSFDPRFEYLRINSQDRFFYLVKGYQDQGIIVWYGASGEVLRFNNGRLVGATGLLTEWRNVDLPVLPTWGELVQRNDAYRWTRRRDVMPGYRYGIADGLSLVKIPPPVESHLSGIAADKLIWLEESDLAEHDPLPAARYALDPGTQTVVYGETCLATSLCFTWQSWPKDLQ